MKQNKLFYGMALLATLGLAGCSNDLPGVDPDNQPSDVDRKVYVNLAISGDMVGTRAAGGENGDGNPVDGTDFAAGTGQESTVEDVYFVFYDTNGNQVGNLVHMTLTDFQKQRPADATGTVEERYYKVVSVDVFKGQAAPSQVMCYVNPISPADLENPINKIQEITRDAVDNKQTGNTQRFAMSNSVYYSDETGNPIVIGATIPTGGTFATEALAQAELNKIGTEGADLSKVTEIYLERYATKLTFKLDQQPSVYTTKAGAYNADGTVNSNGPAVALTFGIKGWALNGESKSIYAVKSFRQKDQTTGQIMPDNDSYDNLNNAINENGTYTWAWNNATYHRSYWAKSPAYFQATYPEVASDVNQNGNQKYISYKDITTNGKGFTDVDGQTPHYFMETTVGIDALRSENPAAAIASVILVGQYTMTVGGTQVGTDGVISFYTYTDKYTDNGVEKPYIFFENTDNTLTSTVNGTASMLERFLKQQTILVKSDGVTKYTPAELQSICVVKRPALNLNDKLADRRYSLQIELGEGEALPTEGIYVITKEGLKKITTNATAAEGEITLADANTNLYKNVGTAVRYTNGMGFFNIPVRHYGFYRTGNPNADAAKIDWQKVSVGDFGMVRNHVYNIEVQSITGLATGIAGEETPIIPPKDFTTYFMAVRFNILKWAVVPTQSVIL